MRKHGTVIRVRFEIEGTSAQRDQQELLGDKQDDTTKSYDIDGGCLAQGCRLDDHPGAVASQGYGCSHLEEVELGLKRVVRQVYNEI